MTTSSPPPPPPPPKIKSCTIEKNINYPGGDLLGVHAETNDECCELCINLDECKAYAFIEKSKYCYLKNVEPKQQQSLPYDGIIYGIVIES